MVRSAVKSQEYIWVFFTVPGEWSPCINLHFASVHWPKPRTCLVGLKAP